MIRPNLRGVELYKVVVVVVVVGVVCGQSLGSRQISPQSNEHWARSQPSCRGSGVNLYLTRAEGDATPEYAEHLTTLAEQRNTQ